MIKSLGLCVNFDLKPYNLAPLWLQTCPRMPKAAQQQQLRRALQQGCLELVPLRPPQVQYLQQGQVVTGSLTSLGWTLAAPWTAAPPQE